MYQVIEIFNSSVVQYQASKRPSAALPYSVHLLIDNTLHNGHYFKTIQQMSDYITRLKEANAREAERLNKTFSTCPW